MIYYRKVTLNNIILIFIIIVLCISLPIGYLYINNTIFNTVTSKNSEKEYAPLPHITIRLQSDGKEINLVFSHLQAPTDNYNNIVFLYKDSDGNEYFIGPKNEDLLGVNFITSKTEILNENVISSDEIKVKAETFLSGVIDLSKYEFDGENNTLDNNMIVLSWSKHANKIMTSDSVVVTMYKDGSIKSLAINNNGFYDENIVAMPMVIDEYSDELTAETLGVTYLINSVNSIHGTNISSFTKKYSKLEIDTDLKLYWYFVFYLDISAADISNGIEKVYNVKVNALTNDVILS